MNAAQLVGFDISDEDLAAFERLSEKGNFFARSFMEEIADRQAIRRAMFFPALPLISIEPAICDSAPPLHGELFLAWLETHMGKTCPQ